jgi:hypothetical protein
LRAPFCDTPYRFKRGFCDRCGWWWCPGEAACTMHGRGMALPAAAAPACLHASVCAASSCVMLPGQPYDRASALTLRQCSRPCGVERVHGGGGVVAAATAAAAAAQVHATKLTCEQSAPMPSAAASAMRSAMCRCWAGSCQLTSVSMPHPAVVEPGVPTFRFPSPRYGLRLGWELGHVVEWCCRHLLPAFLGPLCMSQAGANAGGMPALHQGGRWTYLGWLDCVRCGWPRGRVLQVGLAKVSWTSAPSVCAILTLKLMHEAGWGASQPREQAAGDLRSVTSSWVLGVVVGRFGPMRNVRETAVLCINKAGFTAVI